MKTIVVTGASKGIGYETSLKLLNKGHKIIAIARTSKKLTALQKESNSELLIPIASDITSEKSLIQLQKIVSNNHPIDGLINNAGILANKPFMETSEQDWKKIFDVNLHGPVRLIQLLKKYFAEDAHIVNIGSMGGIQGSQKFPGLSAYSASKGALAVLTESLSAEFAADKISVNCLSLGAVQTEMLNKAFPGYKAPVSAKQMGAFIADFVLMGHQFMNGKIIPVSLNNPE